MPAGTVANLRLYEYSEIFAEWLSGKTLWNHVPLLQATRFYREDKGEIYSEALNLSAHVSSSKTYEKHMVVTEEIHHELTPREKRYFHMIEPYLGYNLYQFTNLH